MTDVLNLIEQIKQKGNQMNANLGQYAETNVAFRKSLQERLQAVSELIKQLNLADVGKNRVALEQANKDLEATRKELEAQQQELQQTRSALAQAQQELASANQSTQSLNEQMQKLQEETEQKMNALNEEHAKQLEQVRQENAKQLSDAQTATQEEKEQMNAECERRLQETKASCEQEKQELQSQLEAQRANIEQQMKEAQDAREAAEQQLQTLQQSQESIQNGLSEINRLIDNQLTLIQQVIDSEPTNDNLNAVVEAINQNLNVALNMLNQAQTQAQTQGQKQFIAKSFPVLDRYNALSEQEKEQIFAGNSSGRANFEEKLRQAYTQKDTNPRLYNKLMLQLENQYNQLVKSGGRHRPKKHIVTKHTIKKGRRARLSGKPPTYECQKVVYPMRKTKKRAQKGGYKYKDDISLRRRSSVVEEKRTPRYTKRTSSRSGRRMTKKRARR